MNILITGDMGTIGEELKKQLTDHNTFLIDKKRGDCQDLSLPEVANILPAIFNSFQPDVIFHLAAYFERTKETPESYKHLMQNNIIASHNLIKAAVATPSLKTFVFASSYLIYDVQGGYLAEECEYDLDGNCNAWHINPRNLCGLTKLYTERELEHVCASIRPDLRAINARISRVYGHGSESIINRWCSAKRNGEKAVIFNETNRFDFIFARDVAEGLKRLAFTKEAEGIVNLGTGISRSVREALDIIGAEELKVEDDDYKESSCMDVTKLLDLTGWKPSISLEEGIEELMQCSQKS